MEKSELIKFIKGRLSTEKGIEYTEGLFSQSFTHAGLDSLSIVVLLCEIEDYFLCDCSLEKIDFTKISTLDLLIDYLCKGADND